MIINRKYFGLLGLAVALTISNVSVGLAGDLTGYDVDGDSLIDYLDDSGNLWPNQQAWVEPNAFMAGITGEDTTSAQVASPPMDTDGDGLTDEEEAIFGTNPLMIDTDGGGLSDYEEVYNEDWRATDPLNPADDSPPSPSIPTDNSYAEDQPPPANEEPANEGNGSQDELVEGLTTASNACYGIAGGCSIVAVVAAETGVGWPVAVVFGVLAGGFCILGATFGEASNQAANFDSDPDPLP